MGPGSVLEHQDLAGIVTVNDDVTVHDHATHVAGTIGGTGLLNPAATGIAPGVNLLSWDWHDDETELLNATRTFFLTGQQDHPDRVVISNHSYSSIMGWNGSDFVNNQDDLGRYTDQARRMDQLVIEGEVVIFRAAGNERNDTSKDTSIAPDDCDRDGDGINSACIVPPAAAKNVITVGAMSSSTISTDIGSSLGPTEDGRIKPDVMANGNKVLSTTTTEIFDITGDGQDDFPCPYATMTCSSLFIPSSRTVCRKGLMPLLRPFRMRRHRLNALRGSAGYSMLISIQGKLTTAAD